MKIPKHIFREYDVRGVAGVDLTEELVETLGRAIAVYLKGKAKHNCMVIGHDGRLTSRAFAHALMDGLHVGQFVQAFEAALRDPGAWLGVPSESP